MDNNVEKELKILLVEDVEADAGLVEHALRKGNISFVSKRVDERDEFVEALNDFHPDVILSDHSLPQFSSMDALKLSRKQGYREPFILVTGSMSDEFAVRCLKEGADDYVLKSNLTRLPAAIKASLRQHHEERQRITAEWALRKQNEELIKINKELDNFVYSVSHNLRAPLLSVLGLLHLAQLETEDKSNTIQRYFNMMDNSIHRLDDTLAEILDYSRNSRLDLNIEKIDIRSLIAESLHKLEFIEGFDRVKHTVIVEGEDTFFSDGYRLSIVLNNLLSNAIKYQDPDKDQAMVEITTSISGEKASIQIRDNGLGIDDDFIEKVFDMFFRANERSDGAGLGLYIAREIVGKLKGKILLKTEPKVGSTFTIELPNHPHAA